MVIWVTGKIGNGKMSHDDCLNIRFHVSSNQIQYVLRHIYIAGPRLFVGVILCLCAQVCFYIGVYIHAYVCACACACACGLVFVYVQCLNVCAYMGVSMHICVLVYDDLCI